MIALFINWVEGEDTVPVPEKDSPSRNPGREKRHSTKVSNRVGSSSRHTKELTLLYDVLSVVVCLTVICALLVTVSWLPKFGSSDNPAENEVYTRYVESELREAGAVNTVAGMILDYRAFDTLGESNVLFVAVVSVIILLRADRKGKNHTLNLPELATTPEEKPDDEILRFSARILIPAVLLFGIYVVLNGHLSPGGGFSGGAILGSGLIILSSALGFEAADRFFTARRLNLLSFAALGFYALSKCYVFFVRFFTRHIDLFTSKWIDRILYNSRKCESRSIGIRHKRQIRRKLMAVEVLYHKQSLIKHRISQSA